MKFNYEYITILNKCKDNLMNAILESFLDEVKDLESKINIIIDSVELQIFNIIKSICIIWLMDINFLYVYIYKK